MSFRRRNEPLSNNDSRRVPPVAPLPGSRIPTAQVAPMLRPSQVPSSIAQSPFAPIDRRQELPSRVAENRTPQPKVNSFIGNPAVKPSLVTSQPTVSTGCADLDKIMVHLGLPLSNMILIEESGTTDFSLVLLRAFASQGVIHNRLKTAEQMTASTHVVVVGAPSSWARDLPGEYKGSSKEQKKAQIAQDSAQVSVANMVEKDLKIAWRYGLQKTATEKSEDTDSSDQSSILYLTQFDITQRLVPGAGPQDITFVPLSPLYTTVTDQVRKIVQQHVSKNELVRIVVPGLLNPSMYSPQCCSPAYIIPLIHSLKAIVSATPLVLMASIALDLFPRDTLITHLIESIVDGVIHLQPFNAAMTALLEKAYKNEPAKVQQGLVNILKLPVLSARGMMVVANGEYAFKNGRKRFAIEEWGIPVEDGDENEKKIDF